MTGEYKRRRPLVGEAPLLFLESVALICTGFLFLLYFQLASSVRLLLGAAEDTIRKSPLQTSPRRTHLIDPPEHFRSRPFVREKRYDHSENHYCGSGLRSERRVASVRPVS